ncbi:MAG: DNA-binding protein [archaeon]
MSDLEELKRKRLEQMMAEQQNAIQQQMAQEAQLEHQVQQLEAIVKQRLTKEALERYGNLKSAHPETAIQLLIVLAQAIQRGQIMTIDDEKLRQILMKLTPKKREFSIRRK